MSSSKMYPCGQCKANQISGHNFCSNCGLCLKEPRFNVHQAPELTRGEGNRKDEMKETHPAYAQLAFSRQSTNKTDHNTLYGSAIRHQTIISMRVYPSEKHYDNYSERYYGGNRPYIEVEMSQAQFSEAITSMNMGSGVPVTLKSLRGEIMPVCIEQTIQERTQRDLNSALKNFAQTLVTYKNKAEEILEQKGPLKVDQKRMVKNMFDHLLAEIQSNLPFLNSCLQEVLDKNTAAAKSDIEAFLLHAVTVAGLEYIKENKDILPAVNVGDFKQLEG